MAEDTPRSLRGGRITRRDPWFGLRDKPGFDAFKRHWHREKRHLGRDLQTREEALEAYEAWAAEHLSR
jgi:hypothetical protein